MKLFSVKSKVVFITGTSRGIGKAIALKLGKDGATVIGTATTDEGVKSISNYLNEAGIKGKRNIIRHSFGAYHYHSWANQGATMKEMGHTKVSTFMKHYYAWNPEEEAPYLYWRLLPEGAKKETKMVEPDFQSVAT